MESLSDTHWDVVISGTGLQQSLLALALSRSGKNILHVDDNTYYGGAEAAFTLQEADEWAAQLQADEPVLAAAEVVSRDDERLASPRSYSLALAPQIIHARSELLSQLVSSKAFRQIEFLSVGSFYIFEPSAEAAPSLSRVPSTREDVFANTAIPSRSKRFLMKFLKFVLEYDAEPQTDVWTPRADEALADFLGSEFKLDAALQTYVITLTLSPDGRISVRDGLAAIHRHMTSMGRFGTGFAAVYPKWGGLSEVAQVGCRASAVGGAVYMLGTGIRKVADTNTDQGVEVALANDVTVKTKALVQPKTGPPSTAGISLSRLTVVVKSGLSSVFETFIEGAPTPAVAVVGFAAGSVKQDDGTASAYPVYAMVHSSDTGECPVGQSIVYLSTVSSGDAKDILRKALAGLLSAVSVDQETPNVLYELYYEQKSFPSAIPDTSGPILGFPPVSLDLAFDDAIMTNVNTIWKSLTKDDDGTVEADYMNFNDREGADDDDGFD